MRHPLRSLALVGTGVAAAALAATNCRRPVVSTHEALPITRVVLYQNGMAYFERRGDVAGDAIDVTARRDALDDVLKSLTVVDRGNARSGGGGGTTGGRVANVRVLPAALPTAETTTIRVGLAGGAGPHPVTVSYVTDASGWRPTYRLLAQRDNTVRVQGFAMVYNRSGEGWQGVSLALSTGVPLSFRYTLRESQPTARPEFGADGRLVRGGAGDPLTNAAPLAAAALGNNNNDNNLNMAVQYAYAAARRNAPMANSRAGRMVDNVADDTQPARAASPAPRTPTPDPSTAAAANGNGAMVIDQPPTERGVLIESASRFALGAGESGMVPIVDANVPGEVVLLYRPSPGAGENTTGARPYRAVLFQNPLDAPLLGGPVAVHAEGQFVGDGVTAVVPARAHAIVGFAVEPGVTVDARASDVSEHPRAVALRAGRLEVETDEVHRTEFRVSSTAPRRERAYLFVPAREGYGPRGLPASSVITSAGYYVPAPEGAGAAGVTVDLVRHERATVDIAAEPTSPHVSALLALLSAGGGDIPADSAARLGTIADRMHALAGELPGVREQMDTLRGTLAERRESLAALSSTAGPNAALRARLSAGIARDTAALDALTRRVVSAGAEQLDLRQEWFARLRELTVAAR